MHKKIIIILISIIIVISAAIIIVLRKTNPSRVSEQIIIIETPKGDVKIPDIYANPPKRQTEWETIVEENEKFSIASFNENKTFSILVLSEPLSDNRKLAEQAFLNKLQISKTDACKLTVYLQVPTFANPNLSGFNYGISFCQGSKEFGGSR